MLGLWCREQDLNLHALRHWILSPARLPIPPSRRIESGKETSLLRSEYQTVHSSGTRRGVEVRHATRLEKGEIVILI